MHLWNSCLWRSFFVIPNIKQGLSKISVPICNWAFGNVFAFNADLTLFLKDVFPGVGQLEKKLVLFNINLLMLIYAL